ncbi:MAG: hypothetical protein ACJ75B_01330 [Flavisolibacter sp.]
MIHIQSNPRRTRSKKEDKQILQAVGLFVFLALFISFVIVVGMVQ